MDRDEDDEWTRPTLLGAAFRAGDAEKAEELADAIEDEGVSAWKLDTTLSDLRETLARLEGTPEHAAMADVLERLEAL